MNDDALRPAAGHGSERLIDGPEEAVATLILAHGAGAGMDAPFMQAVALGIAERGLRVIRFEFPYMAASRHSGTRRPPDRPAVLRQAWLDVLASTAAPRPFIGGKSLGGRVASLIADELDVAGLVCLGYPFHPVGKPDVLRIDHLRVMRTPTLILQGERDPFGSVHQVGGYPLSPQVRLRWLPDGDHGFTPRVASGRTQAENWREAVDAVYDFVAAVCC